MDNDKELIIDNLVLVVAGNYREYRNWVRTEPGFTRTKFVERFEDIAGFKDCFFTILSQGFFLASLDTILQYCDTHNIDQI